MVVNILKTSASYLFSQQKNILSAAFVIMLSAIGSLLLGLLRTRLLAAYFGNSIDILESYIAATKVPEFFFEVIILSAISISFIPVFSRYLEHNKQKLGWQMVSQMMTASLAFFLLIAIIILAFADLLATIVAPGKPAHLQHLTANLIRMMVVPQFFFTISILLSSVLQSYKRFFLPALAAVVYNLGIIFGIIVLSPTFGIYGPVLGMMVGAFAHMLLQLPMAVRLGFNLKINFNFFNPEILNVWKLASPRVLALAASRVGDIVNISLASLAPTGSVVAFNFAQLLQFFPITLIGSSIAQAALPTFATEYNNKRLTALKATFLTSLHQMLFLIIPIAVILAVLRIPAIRLVFGASQFPWPLTVLTGQTLIVFTIGLAAQASSLLLIRTFYAIHDPKTPLLTGIISSGTNITLSFIFVKILSLPVLYLAAAYATGNIVNAFLLIVFLDKKIGHFNRQALFIPALKMLISALIMALFLYVPIKFLDQVVIDTTKTLGLIILTGIAGVSGLSVYFVLTWFLKVSEAVLFIKLIQRIIRSKDLLSQKQPVSEIPPKEIPPK